MLHGNFEREARPLLKRYRSLAVELGILGDALKVEPHLGKPIDPTYHCNGHEVEGAVHVGLADLGHEGKVKKHS